MYKMQRMKRESLPERTEKEFWGNYPYIVWTGCLQKTPVVRFHSKGAVTLDDALRKVGEHYRLSYKLSPYSSPLIRHLLWGHGFHEALHHSEASNLIWTGHCIKSDVFKDLKSHQKINHFPNSEELGRKDLLCRNIKRMQKQYKIQNFNFIPMSFVLPEEYQDFSEAFSKNQGLWITKPVNSSQGHGIHVVSSLAEVSRDDKILVSQYISNPFLVNGYKFDFRLYVLVTSYDPLIIYLYKDGLTRFATVKYDREVDHLKNKFMHLTNTSINKKSLSYITNKDQEVEDQGSIWTFSAMLRYLKELGKDTTALISKIEDLIIKTFISVEEPIAAACESNVPYTNNCFELYGFDIMLDENLKPWLLEVNLSPALTTENPVEEKVKVNLMADTLTLVGVECQDPRLKNETQTPSMGYNRQSLNVAQHAKDADERKGGFIRLFPRPNTWDQYRPFLQCLIRNNVLSVRLFGLPNEASNEINATETESRQNKYEQKLATLPKILCFKQPKSPTRRKSSPVKTDVSNTPKQPDIKRVGKLAPFVKKRTESPKPQIPPLQPRPPLIPKDTKRPTRHHTVVCTKMEKDRIQAPSKDTILNKPSPLQKERCATLKLGTIHREKMPAPVLRNQALHRMQPRTDMSTKACQMRQQKAAETMKPDNISQREAGRALGSRRPVGPTSRVLESCTGPADGRKEPALPEYLQRRTAKVLSKASKITAGFSDVFKQALRDTE